MKHNLLIAASLLILGCSTTPNEINVSNEAVYFPLKDFVEVQVSSLEGKLLRKKSSIRGKEQVTEKALSNEDWLNELDVFIRGDIDNPSLRQSYITSRSENFLTHELKPGEKSKVKKITVRFSGGKVADVSVVIQEDNLFYSSEMRGVLHINANDGLLSHYFVYGTQEVLFLPKNNLYTEGVVLK